MVTDNSTLLKWGNIFAFSLMVLVNGLAGSTTLLGGENTAEILSGVLGYSKEYLDELKDMNVIWEP